MRNMVLITLNQVHTILKVGQAEATNEDPTRILTRMVCKELRKWARFSLPYAVGLSYLEAHFRSSNTFSHGLWGQGIGYHQGDGPLNSFGTRDRITQTLTIVYVI